MKSPTLIWRNRISITPEARFESDPCKANPIAKPAAPSTATKDAVCMPTWLIAEIITNIIIPILSKLTTNLLNVASTCFFSSILPIELEKIFATHKPIITVKIAPIICNP